METVTREKIELPLYPFQKEVVEFMENSNGCINACFTGAGKSIMTLELINRINSEKNLIVCPKSVLYNWRNEILKWIPDAKVFVIDGNKIKRQEIYNQAIKENKYFMIINYEILRIDIDSLLKI